MEPIMDNSYETDFDGQPIIGELHEEPQEIDPDLLRFAEQVKPVQNATGILTIAFLAIILGWICGMSM